MTDLTLGTAVRDGTAGTIDARRLNRHTFWCGQSGSGKTYSLGVLLEQALTGAATLWGPDAVNPLPWLPNQGGTTSEVTLSADVAANVRVYDSSKGDVGGLDGVAIITWSDEDGDWVLTTSGLASDLTLDLAGEAARGGPAAMANLASDFQDMTPTRIGGPSGLSWIVEYGATDALEGVQDPGCAKTGCPFPSDPGVLPDHMTLSVTNSSGIEGGCPGPSTQAPAA